MNKFRRSQSVSGLLLVLALAGCSGSSEILDGSPGRPVADEVSGVLHRIVLPALKGLAVFSPVNQPMPPRAESPATGETACAQFDPLCRSGGFQVCRSEADGSVRFHYESCARPSGLLNGNWVLAQQGLLATAEFDLSLNDLLLTGRIEQALDDTCWRNRFDSFVVAGRDYSAVVDGTVDYCLASGVRGAELQITVVGPANPYDLALRLDASSGTAVLIQDEGGTTCSLDIRKGAAVCAGER